MASGQDLVYRYFVRVSGSCEDRKDLVEAAFGKSRFAQLEGADEFAFFTGEMKEARFMESLEILKEELTAENERVLQVIRGDR